MSHNITYEALPLIVPFFGGAVILSLTAMCCGFRRFRNHINYLEERVAALEARPYTPTTHSSTPPMQVYIPSYPPPPYSYAARATAPPSASF